NCVKDFLRHGKAMIDVSSRPIDAGFLHGDHGVAGPHKVEEGSAQAEASIKRAQAAIGQAWQYNPFAHNCQHFSSSIVTGGTMISPEAEKLKHIMDGQLEAEEIASGVKTAAHKLKNAAEDGAHHVADGAKHAAKKLKKLL